MKCSAFIAASADGYIATSDGGVEWLEGAGCPESGNGASFGDGGFAEYIASVDCMIMGRNCMEKLASFNLTPNQWPYPDIPIFALSKSVRKTPENLAGKVDLYSGDIPDLIAMLESDGHTHAYIDGGATITSFIELGFLDEICVTQVPILLGEGFPLFGALGTTVKLSDAQATVFSNDFVQWKYKINNA